MGEKTKKKSKSKAKPKKTKVDAPIESVGAEKVSIEEKKSRSVTSEIETDDVGETTAVIIDDVRYNQLNRVAVGYGMKKHELVEFFKKEVSSEIEVITHTHNNRQIQFKYKDNMFPKEGYYSSK